MKRIVLLTTVLAQIVFFQNILFGHCDTMNGPVVLAAVKALETGDVNLILIWVQKSDETMVKEAFDKTLTVRKLSPEAKKLAEMYFFETLVRIHRAGEGVAYTGLKPAETEVEPGISAADNAIASGSSEELLHHLDKTLHHNINAKYNRVVERSKFKPEDVRAGREYVEAYVQFIHYVEQLHKALTGPSERHLHKAERLGIHQVK